MKQQMVALVQFININKKLIYVAEHISPHANISHLMLEFINICENALSKVAIMFLKYDPKKWFAT